MLVPLVVFFSFRGNVDVFPLIIMLAPFASVKYSRDPRETQIKLINKYYASIPYEIINCSLCTNIIMRDVVFENSRTLSFNTVQHIEMWTHTDL